MKLLPLPIVNDASIWTDLATNVRISDHALLATVETDVVRRYARYHATGGDLKRLRAVAWARQLEPRLSALYSSPPRALSHLAAIRRKGSAIVCPMCGSSHSWSLDHVAPKAKFPEFYLYSRNLVPACPCNSLRNDVYVGAGPGERVLHPYYDRILERRLVRAAISPPFPRVKIAVRVCVTEGSLAPAVRFHVRHTLERTNVREFWTDLWASLLRRPREVLRLSAFPLDGPSLKSALKAIRDGADAECGTPNNWRSMFYTGVLRAPRVRRSLVAHINGIVAGTIDPRDF